jgi:hypothetical protein
MLKAKYWITSFLLLMVLNLISFINYYISQILLAILEPFGEWFRFIASLVVSLPISLVILGYFHLWIKEKRVTFNLDRQSIKSAISSVLILFMYYNTIVLIDFYSKYFINVEIMKTNHWSVASIYFIIFCAFFYFFFDNFKITRK